ncbi:MAG TPA: histidine phosphatase family protein [Terrimesophilobacter sp.]|nr:histidine phosphatase family protein [Terrimesophilobacter sp.]
MRLFLIRHGQTPSNILGALDTGHPGPGLTDLGSSQALALVDAFTKSPVEALYASTLVRTQHTAAPLAAALGLDVDIRAGLHEIEAGALEMRTDRESIMTYVETAFAWSVGEYDRRMPDGPDGHDFFGRFDADIEAISSAGVESAALVSHGAAIRVWVAHRSSGLHGDLAADYVLRNTGIVELEGSTDDGWRLVSWEGKPAVYDEESASA